MPFVAYVHAREPDPEPDERPAWEPEWRLWRWVAAALVLAAGASLTQGLVSLVLVLAGLRDHMQ